MKRRCSGCGQRKEVYCDAPGGKLCSGCASSFGMKGHGRNVAEANSRAWKAKPCQHPAVTYSYETKWFTTYHVSHCQRCKVEVTRMISGYHGKRR